MGFIILNPFTTVHTVRKIPYVLATVHTRSAKFLMLKHIVEDPPMEGVRRHAAILRIPKGLYTYCSWTSSHGGRVAAWHGLLPKSIDWNSLCFNGIPHTVRKIPYIKTHCWKSSHGGPTAACPCHSNLVSFCNTPNTSTHSHTHVPTRPSAC